MNEAALKDMDWWVERGLDDLISRLEIAARIERMLDWYREHPSPEQTAEDALLDILDILCGYVSPHMKLERSWPKPMEGTAPSAEPDYQALLEQVARDAELLLAAEDTAYPDAINASIDALTSSLGEAKAHQLWSHVASSSAEADLYVLVDAHGSRLGEYRSRAAAVSALLELVEADPQTKDDCAIIPLDANGKRRGNALIWKDLA